MLAANNRSLGQSPTLFSDVEECLDGMRLLRRRLPEVEIVTKCSGRPQQWTWHLHYDGAELAVSSRGYQRRIRARYAGVSFSQLALVAYGSPCVVP
ncbi:hypothetical protein ABZ863_12870 [Saccharomonospora sp. NPDC046836]|uniref:hypothetical protein n=1 Tax=Saccharomonospora sp. NPDC046836 TaxID=3156921 RepID=UPI0033CAE076